MVTKTGQAILDVISTKLARPTASGASGQVMSSKILNGVTLTDKTHLKTRLTSSNKCLKTESL
jgi:hypothetical protein